jgi:phosphonate transport system substrate-binding protein
LLLCLALIAAACGGDDNGGAEDPADTEGAEEGDDWPDRVVIGLVPSREADVLVETAQPLADALADALGVEVESFVPTDYTGLIEAMGAGQADIGMFGPLALVRAEERYGVEIVLQSVRFGSLTYVTQWFTNDPDTFCEDEPVADEDGYLFCNGVLEAESGPVGEDAIPNVAGKTVAFVDAASASGYLIPSLQLIQNGLDPNEDIDGIFAGGHDNAVISVYNGDADVGLSFNDARGEVVEDLPDVGEQVVVFAWSREIPNDGAAVRSELPEDLKQAIVDAFIDYASTDEGKEVLNAIYNIDDIVPADVSAFDVIRDAERELGDEFDG